MQSATFLQIIATLAEKLKACQLKMFLKTSINVLSKNEEKKAKGQVHGSHTPFLTLSSNTYLYFCDLSSKFDLGLASEFIREGKGQRLNSPEKLETNCLIKLPVFTTTLKITQICQTSDLRSAATFRCCKTMQ